MKGIVEKLVLNVLSSQHFRGSNSKKNPFFEKSFNNSPRAF